MPDFVTCPSCGCRIQMLLALPGQRVRCIGCGHQFTAGGPMEPAPVERLPPLEALPADEPPPRPREANPPTPRREAEPHWPDADRLPPRRFDIPLPLRPLLDEEHDRLPFCPGCGRRVRWEATTCPHCDEEFEDDTDLRRQQRRSGSPRSATQPHRGQLIANLANASLMFGVLALCGGVTALIGLPLGIVAWVMSNGDLEAMRLGVVDSRGRKQTESARGNAVTGVIFSALFAGGWFVLWLWMR
jgi:hypothetical protein